MVSKNENGWVVADTNVISYLFAWHPRNQAEFYSEAFEGKNPLYSFQTLEEIRFGGFKNSQWGETYLQEIEMYLRANYDIVFPDDNLIQTCANLRAEAKLNNLKPTLLQPDAWIAATAVSLGCPVASSDLVFQSLQDLGLLKVIASPKAVRDYQNFRNKIGS